MQLRPYQEEARFAIHDEFSSGVRSTLAVLPTGTGKTIIFGAVARDYREFNDKPVLLLAHRGELLDQAAGKFDKYGLSVRVEKAEKKAHRDRSADVVVASVQSISRRLDKYDPERFGLIITDEAHHSVSPSYRKIYAHFNSAYHLGVTATPSRHDEIGLKHIYQSCAYQYTIQQAIRDGWLVPIRGMQIEVAGLELERVKIVAGDFSDTELSEMLRQEGVLQEMVVPTMEQAGTRPTIVFTQNVEHCREIAACFNRLRSGSAVHVDGGMDADLRASNLAQFERGERQFLCNVGIATEGYDHPPTSCIALFRPTKSLGLFAQMIGRGSRLSTDKTDCLVLDFIGMDKTVRTVTVMDVLDGTKLNDKEHQVAQQLQADGMDSLEALTEAKKHVASLECVRAKMRALSTARAFDVMQMFELPSARGLYGGQPATEKQLAYITKMGIRCDGLEKGEATQLIGHLIDRQQNKLATFKQIKYLKFLGYNDAAIDELTFERAGELISERLNKRTVNV